MYYGKSQWHQHTLMHYKISISENSNCKKFAKNYFSVVKPHCKNRAYTRSLRSDYGMLGLIMKILVSHRKSFRFSSDDNPWAWASGAN